MKVTNKYSGKKLRRPEISAPFVKINSMLIASKGLSDFEFRLICFLLSYSNGTTITVKNLSEKLNKSERRIIEVLFDLSNIGVLSFSETHIELLLDNVKSENSQCEISHIENITNGISQSSMRETSTIDARISNVNCEISHSNTSLRSENKEDTTPYNNIHNKNINEISNGKSSISSFRYSSEQQDGNNFSSVNSIESTSSIKSEKEMKIFPFHAKEHTWRLEEKVASKFVPQDLVYRLVFAYTNFVNLNVEENSKIDFSSFEDAIIFGMLKYPFEGCSDNYQDLIYCISIYDFTPHFKNIKAYISQINADLINVSKRLATYYLENNPIPKYEKL